MLPWSVIHYHAQTFSVHRYAHYDQNPSFSDFSSFGGWYKPTIKQYKGDARVCSVDIDQDWYP